MAESNSDIAVAPLSNSNFSLCAVCQEMLTNSSECYKTRCNHTFHKNCITQWLTSSQECPVCRRPSHARDLTPVANSNTTNPNTVTLPEVIVEPNLNVRNSINRRGSISNRRGAHNPTLNHNNALRRIHDTRSSRRQLYESQTSNQEGSNTAQINNIANRSDVAQNVSDSVNPQSLHLESIPRSQHSVSNVSNVSNEIPLINLHQTNNLTQNDNNEQNSLTSSATSSSVSRDEIARMITEGIQSAFANLNLNQNNMNRSGMMPQHENVRPNVSPNYHFPPPNTNYFSNGRINENQASLRNSAPLNNIHFDRMNDMRNQSSMNHSFNNLNLAQDLDNSGKVARIIQAWQIKFDGSSHN